MIGAQGAGTGRPMKRKLASLQRVLKIVPIVGADAIEAVRVNGWQCVVKQGTFAVGDRGVFLEIDAIPRTPLRCAFSRPRRAPSSGARPTSPMPRTSPSASAWASPSRRSRGAPTPTGVSSASELHT